MAVQVVIAENGQAAGEAAARELTERLAQSSRKVLCVHGHMSCVGILKHLASLNARSDVRPTGIRVFLAGEYVGLKDNHDQSCGYVVRRHFKRRVPTSEVLAPLCVAVSDSDRVCIRYDHILAHESVISACLLNVTADGYLGFITSSELLCATTHVQPIPDHLVDAHGRFFERLGAVPRYAITIGLHTIFRSDVLVCIATGTETSHALALALDEPASCGLPASVVHQHREGVVFADRLAASELKGAGHYTCRLLPPGGSVQ